MNSKIIIPFSLLFLLTFITPSFAQSATLTPTPSPIVTSTRKQINEIKKETKNEIKKTKREVKQDAKEEKKSVLSELKKNSTRGIYQSIRNSLTKRFEFLQKTKTLLETRITEKSIQGKDVTAVKAKLVEFTAAQSAYTTNLTALDTKLQELINSSEPKKIIPDLRSGINKVRAELNNMHKVLVETIRLLVKVK